MIRFPKPTVRNSIENTKKAIDIGDKDVAICDLIELIELIIDGKRVTEMQREVLQEIKARVIMRMMGDPWTRAFR